MSQDTTGSTATAAPSAAGGQARQDALENLLQENRKFAPSAEFAANAVVTADEYAKADADRPAFWANQARELLTWSKDFDQALDWSNPPFAKWFVGGEVVDCGVPVCSVVAERRRRRRRLRRCRSSSCD